MHLSKATETDQIHRDQNPQLRERDTHRDRQTDRQMTRYILTYVYVHVLLTASVMPVITLEKIANTMSERAAEMPYWTELYCTLITFERFR